MAFLGSSRCWPTSRKSRPSARQSFVDFLAFPPRRFAAEYMVEFIQVHEHGIFRSSLFISQVCQLEEGQGQPIVWVNLEKHGRSQAQTYLSLWGGALPVSIRFKRCRRDHPCPRGGSFSLTSRSVCSSPFGRPPSAESTTSLTQRKTPDDHVVETLTIFSFSLSFR